MLVSNTLEFIFSSMIRHWLPQVLPSHTEHKAVTGNEFANDEEGLEEDDGEDDLKYDLDDGEEEECLSHPSRCCLLFKSRFFLKHISLYPGKRRF